MKSKIDDEIIIGYPKLRISLPVFIAKTYGYFEEQGLTNIKFKTYDTAKSMMDALSSKKLHMGGYCALPIAFSAIEKEETGLLFLTSLHEDKDSPISFILIKKEKEIKTIEELEDKKIGILPTGAYRTWIRHILDINNLDIEKVTIIEVAPDKQLEKLKNGEIDILLTTDPVASNIISKDVGKLVFPKKALITEVTRFDPFYFGSFNVRKEYEESEPEIVLRIALALNKAIFEINNGKSSEKIRTSLENCLEGYKYTSKDVFKGYYKTTNDSLVYDLKDMEQYYYHRGLLSSGVDIKDMQYKLKDKFFWNWIQELSSFVNKHQTISTIVASTTIGLATYLGTNHYNNTKYKEELERKRRTVPAEFILKYIATDMGEKPRLTNIGKSKLVNLEIEMKIYFITQEDTIYQADNMEQLCKSDKKLFKKITSKTKLVKVESDFDGLFGEKDRKFKSRYLNPYSTEDNTIITADNSIDMDFSTSAIPQALKIATALNSQLFTRWKIKYNEEYSAKQKTVYFYMWINKNATNIEEKYKKLQDVIGGKRLISIIKKYENNSKNIIFNDEI